MVSFVLGGWFFLLLVFLGSSCGVFLTEIFVGGWLFFFSILLISLPFKAATKY